ncbi:calcium-binding protein [Chloroflexota bacterium]
MAELELIIVGADGQVIHISEGFINSTFPAGGTMVLSDNGTLEIRYINGSIISISADDANWADNAMVYIGGVWVPYNPAVHDFSFGDTTVDPLLVNLLQSGISFDYFTANNPSANMGAPEAAALGVYNGIWYPPAGPVGVFLSFDGSLTDDLVFERVFIDKGSDPLVYEPGEVDSHTAADWTTSSTPTIGVLNPTQVTGPPSPDVDDGQTVVFGTEGVDTLEGKEGPDFLYGKEDDDTLYGGEGNDLLDGGPGGDTIYGGPGDDLIVDTDTDFDTPGGTAILDGDEGTDTFKFTTADVVESLQLTDSDEVSNRLSGIEILDMRDGQMADSLTINKLVVNALGDNNDNTSSITPDSIPQAYEDTVDIYVRGEDGSGATDTVNFEDAGWSSTGETITIGSDVYDIYVNQSGDGATIVINTDVIVNIP